MKKARNSCLPVPASIDDARKLARIRAVVAAPLWGLTAEMLRKRCIRGEIPDAAKIGQEWWVTPAGMDEYFCPPKTKKARK